MLGALGIVLFGGGARATQYDFTNGILTVITYDSPDRIGLFTVKTGAGHPQPDTNVLFGATLPTPIVDTSFITVRDYTTMTEWVNAWTGRPPSPSPGWTLRYMNSQPWNFSTPFGGSGFSVVYDLGTFKVTQEVVIQGTQLANTSVRHTIRVENVSSGILSYGVRSLWDWKVAGVDAPHFRS
ncbi:MAG: hypothetical protein AAB368_12315, partial [bacterium]